MSASRALPNLVATLRTDLWLIPQCVILPIFAFAGFRLAGVARTQKWLRRWAVQSPGACPPHDPNAIIAAALRVQRAVRRYSGVGGSCLVRSYTLWALLGRRGVDSQIRIGMRKLGRSTEGHAWVEYQETAINEKQAVTETYSVYPDSIAFDKWCADPPPGRKNARK